MNCGSFNVDFGEINYVQVSGGVSSVNGKTGDVNLTANDVYAIPVSEKGNANGVASLDSNGKLVEVPSANDVGAIPVSEKGADNGVATLDSRGRLVQMPDADDVGAIDIGEKGEPYGVATLDENGRVVQLPPLDVDSGIPEAEKGEPFGVATLNGAGKLVQMPDADDVGAIPIGEKGVNNGVATIDNEGYVVQPVRGGTGGAVNSVNGMTGNVVLNAENVGARPNNWMPTPAEIGAIPTSEKGVPNGVPVLDASGNLVGYVKDQQGVVKNYLVIEDNSGGLASLFLRVTGNTAILSANENSVSLSTDIENTDIQRGITVFNDTSVSSIARSLIFTEGTNIYYVLGTHNKPSGTYIGTGSTSDSDVVLGQQILANAVIVVSEDEGTICLITRAGTLVGSPDESVFGWKSPSESARIVEQNGEVRLNLSTSRYWLNGENITYNWRVI